MNKRIIEIDDLVRRDHCYLTPDDKCYFYGEYTARAGYTHSETNDLILNFKKEVDRKGRPEYRFKEMAILKAADIFATAFLPGAFQDVTLIPIPPSKVKSDPLYDDRMVRMLQAMCRGNPCDIRELVIQVQPMDSSHATADDRPSPDRIAANYALDPRLLTPVPRVIVVFDDVLTTGAHFKAAQRLLQANFPEVPIFGVFIARRAFTSTDVFQRLADPGASQ